jgi:hypothetical protein
VKAELAPVNDRPTNVLAYVTLALALMAGVAVADVDAETRLPIPTWMRN